LCRASGWVRSVFALPLFALTCLRAGRKTKNPKGAAVMLAIVGLSNVTIGAVLRDNVVLQVVLLTLGIGLLGWSFYLFRSLKKS
jgi:hypothetical protein